VIRHSAGELLVEREAEREDRSETRSRETRLGVTGVMVEAFNIIQDRITRARLAGDPPDLSLQPKLGHIGLTEFFRADEAISLGYEATKARIGDIERMQTVLV
jgi:NTE family protein